MENNRSFRSLLRQGIITELAVVDMINHNSEFVSFILSHSPQYAMCVENLPYDIHMMTMQNDMLRLKSIEVKSAICGDKYPSFFAEILQTKSNGYAEYLVHTPDYVVYVDVPTGIHYWYDGRLFSSAVKARYMRRTPTRCGKGEGILFFKEDGVFGYIGNTKQTPTWTDLSDRYKDKIKFRLDQKRSLNIYKQAPYLPDLE
jgi:hypothetical protein